ncbi:glycosyltransferase family 39 protein [Candidatus Woesearchaeota archaeon]|nr:glycosyltransferase family 39 protein [Candidatus Woesearchaeota archaeon]
MKYLNQLRQQLEDNKIIAIIIVLFLTIKLFFLFRFHTLIWDEAVYIAMGKYIYSLGQQGILEIIRPIGLPSIFGLSWKLFDNYIVIDEIIELLFAAGSIILVYLIATKVFNKKTAIFAALLYAFTPLFFLYAGYFLSEIPSTFFILLSIYFFIQQKYISSAIAAGAALYFRLPQGLFLIIVGITLFIEFIRKRKFSKTVTNGLLYLFFFFLILSPYMFINYQLYKDETCCLSHALFRPLILASYHQNNPADALPTITFLEKMYNAFYYLIIFLKHNILLIFGFFGIILFFTKRLYKTTNKTFLFVFILISLLYYSIIANKQERFGLVFLPIFSIFAAYGLISTYEKLSKKSFKIAFMVFVGIIMIILLSIDLNFYFWRSAESPEIIKDYYQYYVGKQVDGVILTTDPVPAAYTDAAFHPFYESIDEGIVIINRSMPNINIDASMLKGDINTAYAENSTLPANIFAVIFSKHAFYCAPGDAVCRQKIDVLFSAINSSMKNVFQKEYYGNTYYIYEKK